MKMNHMSLMKRGVLLSLVLLSPAILAAENLNFNYTRSDVSGLDPRLSKLAKACHTLTDPMVIHVLFGPMSTQYMKVTMTVYGKKAGKGYAVYSSSGAGLKKNTADPDLVVPWVVSNKGSASGIAYNDVTTPDYHTVYDDPFCFEGTFATLNMANEYAFTHHHMPIYDKPPYVFSSGNGNDYQKYCMNFDKTNGGENTYWPDFKNPPEAVREGLKKPWGEYQGKYIFYRHKEDKPTGTSSHHTESQDYSPSVNQSGGSDSVPGVVLNFPVYKEGSGYSNITKGKFLVTLDNRNVTSLELDISQNVPGYEPSHAVFRWQRSEGLSNVLAFQGMTQQSRLMPAGDIENDPYKSASFYAGDVASGYFRGTLVAGKSLNSTYTDYINKIMPLSLPPATPGDINLVNTDSLTFKIGMTNGTAGGEPMVTVFGQPLKFGPLYAGDKEMISAMKVRNACY
ncbi:hypothetical protein DOI44_27990 [Salmonella enterica subsp. enterica serovar Panama]|uniref:Uncharacterized protein n=2 Tax=Salmonella enterica TaxID=28901 RepID=A0A5U8JJH0_SALET|nr:hypothetical protein LFZ16_17030 [Salmonella enterica subsp. enterica serovar India str. SA20085604]EBR7997350.1 hypothetical protein [Salmonella enterica subsp. enterica serovar Panama]EBR8436711.1 hypothetical protein [Salmonella enterica subsp. enterica serovar Panama]EBW9463765.1 hypothetical protein [Salmonella enterica subsp. enterica serovar Panama]